MRFCPFCSAENVDEVTHCGTCARRLPPLPKRRRDKTKSRIELEPEVGVVEHPPRKPLSRAMPGPAATRRETSPPPPRERDDPSRRATDVSVESNSNRRATPPPPSRVIRDREATQRASRSIPIAGAPPSGSEPAPSTSVAPPRAASPEPPVSRVDRPARAARSDQSSPESTHDTEPVPVEDDEWPAPPRPVIEEANDPDDWAADARRVLARTQTPPPTPPPRAKSPEGPARAARSDPSSPDQERGDRHRSDDSRSQPTVPRPPPTRVLPSDSGSSRSFKPAKLEPVPDVPEAGLINAIRYAVVFALARWKRRGVIKDLRGDIEEDTGALDLVLGTLGQQARELGVNNRVLASENEAIDSAEKRRARFDHECLELESRRSEENSKFADVESERQAKVSESEGALDRAQAEYGGLEGQRRGLRDKRKAIERQQKGYIKAADDRDEQAAKATMGDSRAALRRAAEDLRRDAAGLDPERRDLERRLAALEKPISQALAKTEALKAELDSARRSLNDVAEGHRHRLAEIEAEQGRKSRELSQAGAEIQRHLVTLGTLVNLHRIDEPALSDLYAHIDTLRNSIGQRSAEIDRLTAEREAYDKASLVRGFVALGGAVLAFLTLIVILMWVF